MASGDSVTAAPSRRRGPRTTIAHHPRGDRRASRARRHEASRARTSPASSRSELRRYPGRSSHRPHRSRAEGFGAGHSRERRPALRASQVWYVRRQRYQTDRSRRHQCGTADVGNVVGSPFSVIIARKPRRAQEWECHRRTSFGEKRPTSSHVEPSSSLTTMSASRRSPTKSVLASRAASSGDADGMSRSRTTTTRNLLIGHRARNGSSLLAPRLTPG
jgi:hypothetical protein